MSKVNKLFFIGIAILFVFSTVWGQEDDGGIQGKVEKFGADYAKGYLGPIFDGLGASMNTGWFNTANVDDGLSLFAGVKVMYLPIPDDSKKFSIVSPYDGQTQSVPTVFGEETEVPVSGAPSGSPPYQKGLNLSFMPMLMPHISIGNIYGTRVMFRYFPKTNVGDFGDFEMFGLGAQHSITKHLPVDAVPVDLAGMFAFQSLKLGTFLEASSFTFGAQASKSFPVVDIYAGLSYETSSTTISYTIDGTSTPVGFDADGSNTVKLTGGVSFSLFILKIHADYSLASQSSATLGVGLGW